MKFYEFGFAIGAYCICQISYFKLQIMFHAIRISHSQTSIYDTLYNEIFWSTLIATSDWLSKRRIIYWFGSKLRRQLTHIPYQSVGRRHAQAIRNRHGFRASLTYFLRHWWLGSRIKGGRAHKSCNGRNHAGKQVRFLHRWEGPSVPSLYKCHFILLSHSQFTSQLCSCLLKTTSTVLMASFSVSSLFSCLVFENQDIWDVLSTAILFSLHLSCSLWMSISNYEWVSKYLVQSNRSAWLNVASNYLLWLSI